VLDLYENIQRHELRTQGREPLTMVTELTAIQRQVLGLLEVPARGYGKPFPV